MNVNNTDAAIKRQRVAELILSLLILVTGILFIVGCLVLYFTGGEKPYSRERVGDFLSWFTAVPSIITVIFAIAVYLMGRGVPTNSTLGGRLPRDILADFSKRLQLELCSSEGRGVITAERRARVIRRAVGAAASIVISLVALIYMTLIASYAGGADFSNLDVIRALAVALPMVAVMLGLLSVITVLNGRSVSREIDAVKAELLRDKSVLRKTEREPAKESAALLTAVRIAVFAIAAIMIAVGVMNGGMADVLAKAVKICTECIGLG